MLLETHRKGVLLDDEFLKNTAPKKASHGCSAGNGKIHGLLFRMWFDMALYR